jgi:hypothetical protein
MLSRGRLGNKTGQGFYKAHDGGKRVLALDLKTLEYRALSRSATRRWPRLRTARAARTAALLVKQTDQAGQLIWAMLRESLTYAAWQVGRSQTTSRRSTTPSAGASATSSGRSRPGTRSVAETAERIRAEGVPCRPGSTRCWRADTRRFTGPTTEVERARTSREPGTARRYST